MTATPTLISQGLWQWNLGAYPEKACFNPEGGKLAFALGDGRVALISLPDGFAEFTEVHDGSVLSLGAHPVSGFITGGDDGRLCHVAESGEVTEVMNFPGVWLEPAAQSPNHVTMAVGAGKEALVLDLAQGSHCSFGPHPATVSGLAISPAGGILAASHIGGVTLWDLDDPKAPVTIGWKGGNLALAFSPDGKYLACSHQENTVHILDLAAQAVFAISGLPGKSSQLAWTHDSRHLMTTGARAVLCWPVPGCFNETPTPVAFAVQEEAYACAVAANAHIPFAAVGFDDGRILLTELNRFAAFPLDHVPGSPVSTLAWSDTGMHLACGLEDGRALLLDLGAMLGGA